MTAAPEAPGNHVADGDDDFMPLQDPGEEMDQTPEEHIERQQVLSYGASTDGDPLGPIPIVIVFISFSR